MDNHSLITQLKEVFRSPEPEEKEGFLRRLKEQYPENLRPVAISHGEFLLRQFFYIGKWVWVLSGLTLLLIAGICYWNPGNYPFALTPLLAGVIFAESGRSFRWKMAELEHAARFSLRSVVSARLFLAGTAVTSGLLIVIWAVQPWLSYSLGRTFLYMMVPYLAAALSASVYERRRRRDRGLGSVGICILSSAFFAAAPFFFSWLYEERQIVIWTAAFLILAYCFGESTRKWTREAEEPI